MTISEYSFPFMKNGHFPRFDGVHFAYYHLEPITIVTGSDSVKVTAARLA
jgi:hypothetical protein